jgi:ABC-type spermidine/putrescine transport system permease subunit I
MTAQAIKRVFVNPLWLAIPGILFLLVFFVYPVCSLLLLSVTDPDTGQWAVKSYTRILNTDVYLRVLGITFRIATQTACLSLIIAYPLAYWVASLPERVRNKALLLVIIPFWTSYLVKTFAWMIMLGRMGVINSILMGTELIKEPLPLLHNEFGVLVGMVHTMVPLAVMTMLPVMTSIDRRLTSAAQTLGASPSKAFWLVYFKLSLPGVTAGGLLVFISSLGFFIVPAFLGGRQQTMLAQLIITQVSELLNWSFAGALSVMMLVTTLTAVFFYDLIFGISSIAGKEGSESSHSKIRIFGLQLLEYISTAANILSQLSQLMLGRYVSERLLAVFAWLIIGFLVMPTLLVIPIGFTKSDFLEFPPPGYSLRWFETYFNSALWLTATSRSFIVAFLAACLATAFGAGTALALAKSSSGWAGFIFGFFLAPMIVPRIVIAVGMFYLFARIGLVASNAGLVIGHTVLSLPFTVVTIGAILKTYDMRLDQAASTLGANRVRTLIHITLPVIKGGLIAAFLFAFITSFDELTVAIFISGGLATTLPKQMWDDMILQLNPTLAAVSTVVLIVVTILLLIAERFRKNTIS